MKHLFISLLFLISNISAFATAAKVDEITRMRETADSLHSIGRTDSAVIVGESAIRLATESKDSVQIVSTNAAQGVFLRSLGKIDEALKCYETALAIVTSDEFRENPSKKAMIRRCEALFTELSDRF